MSIVIGGAVGSAIGTAVIGAGVNMAVGAIAGGPEAGGSGGAAQVADPFASQRGRYQEDLFNLIQGSPRSAQNAADLKGLADVNRFGVSVPIPGQTTGGKLMQQMLTPGYEFNSSDPSYAWRLQQGAGALASSGAARGLLNSGNIATALTNYGQNAASQEFQAQFGRAAGQDQSQQQLERTQYSSIMGLNQDNRASAQAFFDNTRTANTDYENAYQNAYGRLSQLSGATTGSPATAGQLVQQENASAAAGARQIIDPLTGALVSSLRTPTGTGGNNDWVSGSGGYSGYTNSDYGQYF